MGWNKIERGGEERVRIIREMKSGTGGRGRERRGDGLKKDRGKRRE